MSLCFQIEFYKISGIFLTFFHWKNFKNFFLKLWKKFWKKILEKRKNCEGNFTCSEEKCIRGNGSIIRVVLADSAGKNARKIMLFEFDKFEEKKEKSQKIKTLKNTEEKFSLIFKM